MYAGAYKKKIHLKKIVNKKYLLLRQKLQLQFEKNVWGKKIRKFRKEKRKRVQQSLWKNELAFRQPLMCNRDYGFDSFIYNFYYMYLSNLLIFWFTAFH